MRKMRKQDAQTLTASHTTVSPLTVGPKKKPSGTTSTAPLSKQQRVGPSHIRLRYRIRQLQHHTMTSPATSSVECGSFGSQVRRPQEQPAQTLRTWARTTSADSLPPLSTPASGRMTRDAALSGATYQFRGKGIRHLRLKTFLPATMTVFSARWKDCVSFFLPCLSPDRSCARA